MDWTRGPIVGRGSTATVSIATSPSVGILAVKSTKLSQSALLRREQKFLFSVSNPYIVTYKGCGISIESNELYYNLFMEYVSGGTLLDAIRGSGGRLPEPVIGIFTQQILFGLEYLHSVGIIHCDIKGRNILIGPTGAKIADLGCSRQDSQEVVPIAGTPLFMAPEVARGEEQGYPSDIWSLGCTVIEMTTGKSPWGSNNADNPVSVIYRIGYSGESVPEIGGVLSEEAKDFLSKCLRRDPKERWTASQLLQHPFIKKHASSHDNSGAEEFNSKSNSNSTSTSKFSPTSVLDQGIWNCVEESQTMESMDETGSWSVSAAERIRELSFSSGIASWTIEENWVTIRDHQ
ncbi:hypothetical protein Ancab_010909 [Ancistrocladus abbreviatus]